MKKNMRVLVVILLLSLLSGCTTTENTPLDEIKWQEETPLTLEAIQIQSKEEMVLEILEPLFPATSLEALMIQGGSYKDEMTIDGLKEWMLQYYTMDLTNETCDLIIYKSQFEHNQFHSGGFLYDSSTDVFKYSTSRGRYTTIPLLKEDYEESNEINILKILEFSEDRIRVLVEPTWITNRESEPTWMIYAGGDEKFGTLTLEREGLSWKFGDLTTVRYLIAKANVENKED